MSEYIKRFDPKRTKNSQLMSDVHQLGYLQDDQSVLDVTFGKGNFWNDFVPRRFWASDLDHQIEQPGNHFPVDVQKADFTNTNWNDNQFHTLVFDPPYKYNGTPTNTGGIDGAFGVNDLSNPDDRDRLIRIGLNECLRLATDVIMVKCQNQVVSGRLRRQQWMVANWVTEQGLFVDGWRLADELFVYSYRPQPAGRKQQHAHSTTSALLIFTRV